jgi:hypothetical protein
LPSSARSRLIGRAIRRFVGWAKRSVPTKGPAFRVGNGAVAHATGARL